MNIDNNLGMALFSDFSSTTAVGDQNIAAGQSGKPEGSLFQQLIFRMLSAKNQTAITDEANPAAIVTGESSETGDLLSGLMLAESGQSRLRLLGMANEMAIQKEAGVQTEILAGEIGAEVVSEQILAAGITAQTQSSNDETTNWILTDSDKTQIQTAGAVLAEAGKHLKNQLNPDSHEIQEHSPQGLPGSDIKMTAMKTETMETANAAAALKIEEASQRDSIVSDSRNISAGSTEALQASSSGLLNDTSEKRTSPEASITAFRPEINQPAVGAGLQNREAMTGNAGNSHMETEMEKEQIFPAELGLRNTAQGTAAGNTEALSMTTHTTEASEPYNQIRDQILTKLEQKGPTEFKMQLEPEDLGQIDIKLKLSEGKLMIDILAASSKTQALLTSQVDKLISVMGLQNVQVESVQVGQQTNSQTQDSGQNQGFSMNAAMDFSQRKQQEQYQQQFVSNGNLNGPTVFRQDDFNNENPVNLGLKGYDSHRMNYTV